MKKIVLSIIIAVAAGLCILLALNVIFDLATPETEYSAEVLTVGQNYAYAAYTVNGNQVQSIAIGLPTGCDIKVGDSIKVIYDSYSFECQGPKAQPVV